MYYDTEEFQPKKKSRKKALKTVRLSDDETYYSEDDPSSWTTESQIFESPESVPLCSSEDVFDGKTLHRNQNKCLVSSKSISTPSWQIFLSLVDKRDKNNTEFEGYEDIKYRKAWFVIDEYLCSKTSRLNITLYSQKQGKNQRYGSMVPYILKENEIDEFENAEDRELLHFLNSGVAPDMPYSGDFSGGADSTNYLISNGCYSNLIPQMCDTGRFVIGSNGAGYRSLNYLGQERFKFKLKLSKVDKNLELTGSFYRKETTGNLEIYNIAQCDLILESGLFVVDDKIGFIDTNKYYHWIENLSAKPVVLIKPSDQQVFLEAFFSANSLPEIDMPESLGYGNICEEPTAILKITQLDQGGTRRTLGIASVIFRYGTSEVELHDPSMNLVDMSTKKVHERDYDFEQIKAAALSEAISFIERKAKVTPNRAGFSFDILYLPNVVDVINASDWGEVWAEYRGRKLVTKPSQKLSIRSGADWFDLKGSFDFEGKKVEIPALLDAIKKDQKFIQLGDDSYGMIPEKWLEKFSILSKTGRKFEDGIRFSENQAMLLDCLLSEKLSVESDDKYKSFKKRLVETSIDPMPAPEGFQGKLRDYQSYSLGWFAFLESVGINGCLADDMGLGKTIQVLAHILVRKKRRHEHKPTLIVVPRSLLENWQNEARKFAPELKVMSYFGSNRKSVLLEKIPFVDICVTTYAVARIDIKSLKNIIFDYVVLDEAQNIKNKDSQASKACRVLQSDYRLALTGTPVENSVHDLWAIFEFLNPGFLGSFSLLKGLLKNEKSSSSLVELLAKVVQPFVLRRTKEQVLDELPEKIEQVLFCYMDKTQRAKYDEIKEYYRHHLAEKAKTEGSDKTKIHALEALLRLRQVACDPNVLAPSSLSGEASLDVIPSAKLDMLLEQLSEITASGHKALVFSQFTSVLKNISSRLTEEGLNYCYLDGGTRDRARVIKEFQESTDKSVFLLSLKAGGVGLNLTAADYCFIIDPWWNPAIEKQAIDRAHRMGQKNKVMAYRMIAKDTVEEKILKLQKNKKDLADKLIQSDISDLNKLDLNEIIDLF